MPTSLAPPTQFLSESWEDGSRTHAVGPVSIFVAAPGDEKEPRPALPEVGEQLLEFKLVGELGRGSFGRVFLARQGDLADRLVALKVTSDLFDEAPTLAQLQHTNIVPIFSAHRCGRLQAVCMPFFGSTTLADVLHDIHLSGGLPTSGRHFVSTLESRRGSTHCDLSSPAAASEPHSIEAGSTAVTSVPGARPTFDLLCHYTFVEAVLWLGARMADGLAHAHDRGIIHRDLKPANVLLADDGRPMLLDFNLSASARQHGSNRGGTVPYMAPEILRGAAAGTPAVPDARADIYALGLILYELLAGRFAFPRHKGHLAEVLPKLLADRAAPPPPISEFNPAVTPAIEAIVRRCLAFEPKDRYPLARDVMEDLERQIANLPLKHVVEPSTRERLRKWSRRHPRTSSIGVIGTLAAVALVVTGMALFAALNQGWRRDAKAQFASFIADTDDLRYELIRPAEGEAHERAMEKLLAALAPYGLPHDSARESTWVGYLSDQEKDAWRQRVAELSFLAAQTYADRADAFRHDAAARHEQVEEMARWHDLAANMSRPDRTFWWWQQQRKLAELRGDIAAAIQASEACARLKPVTAADHYLTAVGHYHAGRYQDALAETERATNVDPQHYGALLIRGNCLYKLSRYDEAREAFALCIGLNPKCNKAYFNRGKAYYQLGNARSAEADFRAALARGDTNAEATISLAKCLTAQKKYREAETLLTGLIDSNHGKLRAHGARADLRSRLADRRGADDDRKAVLDLPPQTSLDYTARGLARSYFKDHESALAEYRQAERLNPWNHYALQNQAHILSEQLKKTDEAVAVLNRLLERTPDYPQGLAGRAVLLARLGRFEEALKDAEDCLARFDTPRIRYQVAGVYALTSDRPGHLVQALRILSGSILRQPSLAHELKKDRELDPIRQTPEFRRLLNAVDALGAID